MADGFDRSDDPAGAFRFVGRARELDLLLAAARHAPAVVLVEGEAGIGKSRLVREAAAVLAREGRCVLTGYCHPLREPLPYGPVVGALQQAGARVPDGELPAATAALARLLPELADRLPPAPPRPADPQADRRHLLQAVRAFMTALGPAVLIVEDLHWVDEATRDLLLFLARDLPEQLCLVLTYRPEDLPVDTPVLGAAYRRPPGTSGTVLRLGPLAEADVGELASLVLGERADAALVASLYRRSEGLPLVAEEDLITLREHRPEPDRGDAALRLRDADVPNGLREAVTERLVRLSPAADAVVAAAAVLAVPAAEQVLSEVAGLGTDDGSAGLVEALQASILREQDDDRYAFRHVLAQQVAYRRLPGPTRRRLHASAVQVLERQDPPPLVQIAHHTLALGDRPGWLGRAEQAADQAVGLGDTGTAADLLRRLLQEPDLDPPARSRVARQLAPIAAHGVDFAADAEALRAIMRDRRLPSTTRGEIRLALGMLLLNQAADRAGFDELARAVDELGDTSPAAVPAMVALALDESAGPERAGRWMDRAERAVRGSADVELVARVRASHLTLRASNGDPGVWRAVEELPRHGQDVMVLRQTARALFNTGDCAIDLGEDRRAGALVAESRDLGRAHDYAILLLNAEVDLLRLDALAGRWDHLAERFATLAAAHPDTPVVRVEQGIFLGLHALAQGRSEEAVEHFARAATDSAGQLALSVATRTSTGTAAVRLAQGEPHEAWAVARHALAVVRRAERWPKAAGLLPVAVAAALGCGERGAAEELVREADLGVRGRCAPAAGAALSSARGLLAEGSAPEEAAGEFAASYRIWQRTGRPYHAARSAELLARSLARVRPAEATEALARATAVYTELDATADLARARQLEQVSGLALPVKPGRRGYGNRLSPREREVAELLTRRATNQEIATALFLSPRTVEHHVANVLKKLGTSRGGVATALRETAPAD
ncbi:ATP-binding protein [Kitasatospora sp. NPDC058965]|uniref:ATP-binding protein n=1 Tax=Kitasatospora sp. NPDC058965 TaxID=3346682 RepID=UPI0036B89809